MHATGVMAAAPAGGIPAAADLAPCADCRRELLDSRDRRHGHPFISCARCGPRFTLLDERPGRRTPATTATFPLCPDCQREYDDPLSRRFQAPAGGCPHCGPRVVLTDPAGAMLAERGSAIYVASRLLHDGRIVAVKGPGGYQLFADATSAAAVDTLRRRMHREAKPLAVMFRDLTALRTCAEFTPPAARQLQAPAAPIVIVPRRMGAPLAPGIAPGNPWLGAMLPSAPVHVLLLEAVGRPLVAAGSCDSTEPLCVTADDAHARLLGIADAFLEHDRVIRHSVDDSVVRLTAHGPLLVRRGRGHAPAKLPLPANLPGVWLCTGAQRHNAIAIAASDHLVLSPHIGDLERGPAFEAFQRTIATLRTGRGGEFTGVAGDQNAGVAAARFARSLGVPCVAVQHHLAHVLSCLLENHRGADDVLGVAWDGGSRGADDTIWGGEFFRLEKGAARRFARLRPFRLPGGDATAREPRRALLGLLHAMGDAHFGPFAHEFGLAASDASVLHTMLARGTDSSLTSSMGRLFDGVGALLQLGDRNEFDGQTPLAVEAAAAGARGAHLVLPFPLRKSAGGVMCELDWEPLIEAMVAQRAKSRDAASLASAFHRALAHGIVDVARRAGVATVALTGGCFQNVLLLDLAVAALRTAGFKVLVHREIPPNDNGIAPGQALGVLWGLTSVAPA